MGLREYTMEEDFMDKNLEKKVNAFEYNVLGDNNRPDQLSIEFVPMETTTTRKATREGKNMLSKTKTGSGQTNKVRWNDIQQPVSSPRKKVTKKKLQLGGGFASKGFRSSTSARGYHASTSPNTFLKKRYSSA